MSINEDISSIKSGVEIIRGYVRDLPETSGVYRMLSVDMEVLYVGKAKALKRRVNSYTNVNKLPMRLKRMVALTDSMEFVHTQTEVEALLLESNLIKKLKPRFNILLRDDKSFPYILIKDDDDFPQLIKHRGAKTIKGQYFGPFASAGMVNKTLNTLQRAFLIRNCSDSVFASRSRPCLQYHIKRCTAPCVDYVDKDSYAEQVLDAREFLSGESRAVQERFTQKMLKLSEAMQYEEAAKYRDRIRALTHIQASQDINVSGIKDADIIAWARQEGKTCVQVFFFRGGQNYGNHSYFPRHAPDEPPENILGAFIAQFYERKPVPELILLSSEPDDKNLLQEALRARKKGKVELHVPKRGQRHRLILFAVQNAEQSLARKRVETDHEEKLLDDVNELFELEDRPNRIEVYDNSHISGTNMVGAMIVAGPDGFNKKAYRKFNIKEAEAGDDYGMMREVISRRFKRALKDDVEIGGHDWPDVLLIDGGLGQYNVVKETLEECGVFDDVKLVAIAKGVDRDAGRERFFMEGSMDFKLPENMPVLHYLQRLRDEAHRFAIGSHRARRTKDIKQSPLDEISGIGSKRKKSLLHYFGSAKSVMNASVQDLEKVDGISKAVAQKIYDHFH